MLGMRRVMVATWLPWAPWAAWSVFALGPRDPTLAERVSSGLDPSGAYGRRRKRGRGDHQHEREALDHDAERVARHRITEDQDAPADGGDVGGGARERDDRHRLTPLDAACGGIEGDHRRDDAGCEPGRQQTQ